MKLHFIKVNPTENMTVFIMNQIPRKYYIQTAKKVMEYSSIHAEQVGFIEKASHEEKIRLHMMGGEFCGNATRSLAAVLAYENHYSVIDENEKLIVPLEVSGADKIIYCEVEKTSEPTKFISSMEMPLHKDVKNLDIVIEGKKYSMKLVEFPGIFHIVLNGKEIKNKEKFFIKVKEKLNHLEYDALGMIFYDDKNNFIEPLIYVKETESLVFERGCGSGTAALGVALSYEGKKDINMEVKQPGGSLEIRTKWNNEEVSSIYLRGMVEIVAEGIVYVR